MILEMYMKNCALIEESRLTINSGLNILTGETGAGKSIIIEALGLCLGEKYDRSFLRKGTDKGVCEILVSSKSSNLKEVLDKYDIDYDDDEIIITRAVSYTHLDVYKRQIYSRCCKSRSIKYQSRNGFKIRC